MILHLKSGKFSTKKKIIRKFSRTQLIYSSFWQVYLQDDRTPRITISHC